MLGLLWGNLLFAVIDQVILEFMRIDKVRERLFMGILLFWMVFDTGWVCLGLCLL